MRRYALPGVGLAVVLALLVLWLRPDTGDATAAPVSSTTAARPTGPLSASPLPGSGETIGAPLVPTTSPPSPTTSGAVPSAAQTAPPTGAPESAPVAAGPAYRPASVLFNDPTGSHDAEYAIVDSINAAIDATPPGATITIATYNLSLKSTGAALLAAHDRGVNVQVIVGEGSQKFASIKKLTKAVGDNPDRNSFVFSCHDGCMSGDHDSIMHVKMYLFSQTGTDSNVSMIGSANLTNAQARDGWNNMYTTYQPGAYEALRRYFTDMSADRANENYYREADFPSVSLYMFPKKSGRPLQAEVLDRVSCSGVAPGYGSDGRTLIQVSILHWYQSRVDVARQLWKLFDAGCRVQVVVSGDDADRAVMKVLTKKSDRFGRMEIFDGKIKGRFNHNKTILVNGSWAGRPNAKVVFAGSQNYTRLATEQSNELVFSTDEDRIVDAYSANVSTLISHSKRAD